MLKVARSTLKGRLICARSWNKFKYTKGQPYKLKQHTKVRWDSEFDLLDRCDMMKATLLELYQDPEYEGQRIMAIDWNTTPKA